MEAKKGENVVPMEDKGNGHPDGVRPFIVCVSSVTPAEIVYGPLVGALGDEVRAELKDLEVLATDTPPPDYAFDAEIEGIKRVADSAGEENFHLVGFSAGASAALCFAAKHPERAMSLALVEPPFIGGDSEEWSPEEKAFRAKGDEVMTLPPAERMGAFLGMLLRPGVKPPERPPGPPLWGR